MIVQRGNPYEIPCCICRKINGTLLWSKTLNRYVHFQCLQDKVDHAQSQAAIWGDNEDNSIYTKALNELQTRFNKFNKSNKTNNSRH